MSAGLAASGATPAWIGVVDGSAQAVGLSPPQLKRFAEPGTADKVARRRDTTKGLGGGRGARRHDGERHDLGEPPEPAST